MLFLLLLYSLTGSLSSAGPIPSIPSMKPRADFSCDDISNCRTISSIVWSCLSTIFLCTWVSLHPNITAARNPGIMGWLRDFKKNKLPLLLCSLLTPEYILAWAIRQWFQARDIKTKVPGWTKTHGFFVIMGGFHLYRLPSNALSKPYPPEFSLPTDFDIVEPLSLHSREDEIAEHPLEFADLSIRALAYLSPSETELKDKGKADVLTKAITLAQTLWFVAQCIARGFEHLPLTEIEVVTLTYTMVNVFIYYFWWNKPKDVECPVRVYKTLESGPVKPGGKAKWTLSGIFLTINVYLSGGQDELFWLKKELQVPMFWSGKPGEEVQAHAMLCASIIGIAFGASHFIAWNSEFPSHIELLLWRISCIAITAVALLITGFCVSLELKLLDKWWGWLIGGVIGVLTQPALLLHLFFRIASSIIAFTTLRAIPVDALKTVDWTTFIPHL